MLSMSNTVAASEQYKRNLLGNSNGQQISVCRIEKINSDLTVDVTLLSESAGTKTVHGVRLSSPYKYNDAGAIFIPEEGALAIVVIVSDLYQFIIGYINHSDSIVEDIMSLDKGEYLIQTAKGTHIKLNNNHSIDIHSGGNAAIVVDNDTISEMAEGKNSLTIPSEVTQGVDGDIVYNIEKCYDKDIESPLTNIELINDIGSSSTLGINVAERKPVLEIQKGNVFDDDGQVKLELYEEDNPEVCYRLQVNSGKDKFQILIGKDGSIQLEGNKVKLKCNELDLSDSDYISYSSLNFVEK